MLRGVLEGAGCQQLRELEDHVKSFAECVVRCIYKRDAGSLPPFSVVVGPGLGSSGGKWAFKGGVGDFMAKVLLELGLLLNELCDERGPTRLMFDLTHGINFMPSGALYLAKMLSSLIILRRGLTEENGSEGEGGCGKRLGKLTIEVFNSDPYPPGAKEPVLNLNLVYREVIRNLQVPHTIPSSVVKFHRRPENAKLRRELDSSLGQARDIISSLYYPLSLVLVYVCRHFRSDELGSRLSDALRMWMSEISL
ncbi:MAG: CRISPR-associated DxTHG motif protein [Candidatus Korarchaeum sp.]